MRKFWSLLLVLCVLIILCFSSCSKKEGEVNSYTSEPIASFEDASQIAKNEEDGNYTFAFDPYVLPVEIKKEFGDVNLYKAFADAVITRQASVSIPTRNDYDNIRFAVGNNFPFAFLIENYKYDSANAQILISYNYDTTHAEKITEFKNAVSAIFEECVVNSDNDALAAMSVYRYIAQNFEIAAEEIKISNADDSVSSNIASSETEPISVESNMYSTLINKKGTASSVASLYNFLLMQLGIEGKIANCWVDGTYYSWNLVRLGSKWYHCDITKENKVTGGTGLKYFGMNSERLEQYITDGEITTGEWKWFSNNIPKTKSSRFKDFENVVSWEVNAERKSISAFTEEYSRFEFEF